jgi:hypothetical protein
MTKGLFGRLQQELEAREKIVGLTMSDILRLPTAERQLINWMQRSGVVGWAAVVEHLGQTETARNLLDRLIDQGFVREVPGVGEAGYTVRLAPRRKRNLPGNLWQALGDKLAKPGGS